MSDVPAEKGDAIAQQSRTLKAPSNTGVSRTSSQLSAGSVQSVGGSVGTSASAPWPQARYGEATQMHFEPPPSAALRVYNPDGNIEMELTMDHPTEAQVDALIDIFRNTRRMQ